MQQKFHGPWQRTETVAQLVPQPVQRTFVGRLGELAVNVDALTRGRDVFDWNAGAGLVGCPLCGLGGTCHGRVRSAIVREEIQPHLHFQTGFHPFTFERGDTLFEQLAVQFETHCGDVAALFRAEQVARAANFQIAHGNFEAAAEGRVLLDGADPLAGVGQ